MRIAGVHRGKRSGDVMELTPERKVPEAVILGAVKSDQFSGFSVTVADIKVQDFTHQKNGALLREMWANNRYRASGTATLWLRDLGRDFVHAGRPFNFEIEFHDALDEWKMPDLAVDTFVAV